MCKVTSAVTKRECFSTTQSANILPELQANSRDADFTDRFTFTREMTRTCKNRNLQSAAISACLPESDNDSQKHNNNNSTSETDLARSSNLKLLRRV